MNNDREMEEVATRGINLRGVKSWKRKHAGPKKKVQRNEALNLGARRWQIFHYLAP